MALPYAQNNMQDNVQSRYSPATLQRRIQKKPNQFANRMLEPLGSAQNLEGQAGQPPAAEQQQMEQPAAPQVQPQQTEMSQTAAVQPPVQPPTQTKTSLTGGISARAKDGGQNGGGGNGGEQGGGGKGDGKDKGGGGKGKGDGKNGNDGQGWVTKGLDKKQKKALAGDSTFQQQLIDFLAAENDFRSNYKKENRLMQGDFDSRVKQNKRDKTYALGGLMGDFAGSGMLHSSGYGVEQGNTRNEYNNNKTNMLNELKIGQQEKTSDKTNFLRQLQIQQLQARQDALRRAAAEAFSSVTGGILG